MQSGVSISSKEADIDVKYGLYDLGKERELARCSLKYILTDMNDIRTKYIRFGFHLSEFVRCEYYKDFGYLTMEEFSSRNLGMDKSAVSRCINVFRAFCARNNNGSLTMELDKKYTDFSYSQLCEMVSLKEEERIMITPDMTIKKIREYKKEAKNKQEEAAVSSLPVATSQPKLCIADLADKKGIVLMNHIKKCVPESSFEFVIFDSAGKQIDCVEYDLLLSSDKRIYLRQK